MLKMNLQLFGGRGSGSGKAGGGSNLNSAEKYFYSLTEDEKIAIVGAQTGMYSLNPYVRDGKSGDSYLENFDKNLNSAINKYELKSDIVTYRGVSVDEYFDVVFGGKVTDSYKSSSFDESVAKNFAKNQGGSIIEYHISKGKGKGADVTGAPGSSEKEFLLNKNVKYKKVEGTSDPNRIRVYL